MQVIALNGSSRKNGNTDLILQAVLDAPADHGIQGRIIQLCEKKLNGCLACFKCKGRAAGEVLRDEEGMANMRNLGENMAWLLNRLRGDGA